MVFCVFYVQEHQKTGHGFKSHPTDWEKPGIEPTTPGFQD